MHVTKLQLSSDRFVTIEGGSADKLAHAIWNDYLKPLAQAPPVSNTPPVVAAPTVANAGEVITNEPGLPLPSMTFDDHHLTTHVRKQHKAEAPVSNFFGADVLPLPELRFDPPGSSTNPAPASALIANDPALPLPSMRF